jgi:DNA-binding winged helix-turn-helix (wHTH) protein
MNAESSAEKQQSGTGHFVDLPPFPGRYGGFAKFRVDFQREELYRDGQRIKLQGKVYQTLVVLMSRAGEVVSRQEVRSRLWPDQFGANFDANVNTTINKLRQVLGDSPDNPSYIETIPRRGYSFIAKVEFSDFSGSGPTTDSEQRDSETPVVVPAAETQKATAGIPYTLPTGLRAATLVLAGMIIGAVLMLLWFSTFGKKHRALDSKQADPSHNVAVIGPAHN